ncbi:MAG: ABC transporter permease [Gemmatimonadaceae bacterium]|nr:ABC transporter permease [Gemmatimonadaceae bacterium]
MSVIRSTPPQGAAPDVSSDASPAATSWQWSARFFGVWLVLIVVWELVVRTGLRTGLFMPPPSSIVMSLGRMIGNGTLFGHLSATLGRIALGLAVGGSAGLALGLGMGTSRRLRHAMDPVIAALHPIPRLAFFPLLIVIFGIGEYSKVAAVSLGAFFPMLLNTLAGIRGLNPVHLELARCYGANRWQMFTRILVPGSMPLILTGVRLSANVAFHATVGVEMIGSRNGIGSMLWLSWQTFHINQLYALLIVIATIGIVLSLLIRALSARLMPWLVDRRIAG